MTIKDIARISGCSVSTISRVINDRPDVRPETKEHVLKVMREAGFTPNTNARQLKIQQSRSLVFVVKGTRNIFFSDFLVQLQRAATLYGYNGIVSYLDENANEIDAAEKILREIKPKGMIFLGGSVTNFQNGFANISVPSVLATLVSNELDFPNLSMARPPAFPAGCVVWVRRMPWRTQGLSLTINSMACATTISSPPTTP